MAQRICPHCGFQYDDETGEISDKPTAAPVFAELDKLRGYRPPKRAAEAAAILRMLKKYSPEQIIDTWKKLKTRTFYQNTELYMMTVECQIGAMQSGNQGVYILPPAKFKNQKFGGLIQQ